MSRLLRPPFSYQGPFTALKELPLDGLTLKRGDRVPEERAAQLSRSTIRGLWMTGHIECTPSLEAAAAFVRADSEAWARGYAKPVKGGQKKGPRAPAAGAARVKP